MSAEVPTDKAISEAWLAKFNGFDRAQLLQALFDASSIPHKPTEFLTEGTSDTTTATATTSNVNTLSSSRHLVSEYSTLQPKKKSKTLTPFQANFSPSNTLRNLLYQYQWEMLVGMGVFGESTSKLASTKIRDAIAADSMDWEPFIPSLQTYNRHLVFKKGKSGAPDTLESAKVSLPCIIEATELIDNERITFEAELLYAGTTFETDKKPEVGADFEFYDAFGPNINEANYYEARSCFVFVLRRVSKSTSLLRSFEGHFFSSFQHFFQVALGRGDIDGFQKWRLHGTTISVREVIQKKGFWNFIEPKDVLEFSVLREVFSADNGTLDQIANFNPADKNALLPVPSIQQLKDIAAQKEAAIRIGILHEKNEISEKQKDEYFSRTLATGHHSETRRVLRKVYVLNVLLAQCVSECDSITCDPMNCDADSSLTMANTWKCPHGYVHFDRVNLNPKDKCGNDIQIDNSVLIRMHKDTKHKFKFANFSTKWGKALNHNRFGRSIWDNRIQFIHEEDKSKNMVFSSPLDRDECRDFGFVELQQYCQRFRKSNYGTYDAELLARNVVYDPEVLQTLLARFKTLALSPSQNHTDIRSNSVYRMTYQVPSLPPRVRLVAATLTEKLPTKSHSLKHPEFFVPVDMKLLKRAGVESSATIMFDQANVEPIPPSYAPSIRAESTRR